MDIKLKPCPFCGHEAELKCVKNRNLFRVYDGYPYVQCTCCGAHTQLKYTEHEAVVAWNRRSDDE